MRASPSAFSGLYPGTIAYQEPFLDPLLWAKLLGMRGFEDFFSPLLPRPVNTAPAAAVRRPWDGQEENKNSGDRERDPNRRSSPSSPAGAPSSELPSEHPELAPPSTSSFGSIPSPVRQVRDEREHSTAYSRLNADLYHCVGFGIRSLQYDTNVFLCCCVLCVDLVSLCDDRATGLLRTIFWCIGDVSRVGPRRRQQRNRQLPEDRHTGQTLVTMTSARDAGRQAGCACAESAPGKACEKRFLERAADRLRAYRYLLRTTTMQIIVMAWHPYTRWRRAKPPIRVANPWARTNVEWFSGFASHRLVYQTKHYVDYPSPGLNARSPRRLT